MNPLLIYTPQNGIFLKEALDAVVALLNGESYKAAIEIIMILAVGLVGFQYVSGKKLASIVRFIVTNFLVMYCVLGIKAPVAIIDMQMADGAGEALTVENVPLGIALPAAIISGMGYGVTTAFGDVFHMTDDLDYNKSGMIFGARTWIAATQTKLSMSPDVAHDLSAYIRQCVFAAKLLASHQISPQELVNSNDLISTYFDSPSPIYRVIFQDGMNLSCIDAATSLRKRIPNAAKLELDHLGHLMTPGYKIKPVPGDEIPPAARFDNVLEAANQYYMGLSKSAADTLTQNILINASRDAAADAFAFAGADAALMNYTNTESVQKMHIAEANSFWLAGFRLPYYMTVIWILTLCIFPLVVLMALFPTPINTYIIYIQSQAFLWSWPPMFIIIHFLVSLASKSTINIFGQKTGGVTFSNIDSLANLHSNFAYTAGALAISVPFIAYYIVKGLGPILSNASQHFGGMLQSLSVGEAQSAALGNISMASYNGWNMNYDNTNAHKFDTNVRHAEGRSELQMPNGSLLAQNADGSRVGNSMPAISSAAVSIHGSDRVIDSLHKGATESFNNATQLRTASDAHMQEGLNLLRQFGQTDGNDFRSGQGVSNTTTDSINQDLRTMKDAVKQYNKHQDDSHQVSEEAAISARVNSNKQFAGKVAEYLSGGSIEGSLTGRYQHSNNWGVQNFMNSSEGQSFNKAFDHIVSTVQNNHIDAQDSRNLSASEQIGANFTAGEVFSKQSAAEYGHGLQLQKAASHALENAKSIDSNLGQAFHDWVVEHYPDKGEQVMLQTDSASIATQNKWANEFLHSGVGRSAIANQVNAALTQTGGNLKAQYQGDSARMEHTSHVYDKYQNAKDIVASKQQDQGFAEMNPGHLKDAQLLASQNRQSATLAKSQLISDIARDKISNTDKTVNYKKLNNKE